MNRAFSISAKGISLEGRSALVTGGGRGIGAATARALARSGAQVAILDTDETSGQAVAKTIADGGGRAMSVSADVTDRDAVERAVDGTLRAFGAIDILVNNAGIVKDARLVNIADDDWTRTIDVNLKGAMNCARAVAPHMLERKRGRILSATSVVARAGNFGQTAYAASKAGLIGMTRTWAKELGPHGITANAVAPGFIDTEMVQGVPEKIVHEVVSRIPAARLGRPEEVASVYAFLASDAASFINGAIVGVDGGYLL